MFDVSKWNKLFENYINYHQDFELSQETGENACDQYKYSTFRRMKIMADKYLSRTVGPADYLIAIRDYLITCKTTLHLYNYPDNHLQEYGLYESTGELCASYQIPNYLNASFVKTAFLTDYSERRYHGTKENLCTNQYIKNLTGYSEYRSMSQKLAVTGALNTPDGYTTLISIPTGGGKSLVTQSVAYQKMNSFDQHSLTIVVVPTISLALDQERVAKKTIRIAKENEIFSYSSGVESAPIIKTIHDRKAKLLFISPEALILNSSFRDAIMEANQRKYLKNIIIDEAHIVSDWGALFRVDYQCLESWRDDLILTNDQIRTFLLSATFDKRCTDQLKNFFSEKGKWIEIRCDALRKEPRYCLVNANGLFDQNNKILEMVRKLPHPMIIYVAKPDEAETLKEFLTRQEFKNIRTFTGKTNSAKRKQLIHEWVNNEFEIMIATSAFGMGVDKNDVRTVIHAYVPQNPNTYYQELGRGGRDKLPCLSVMCIKYNDPDAAAQRIFKQVMTTEKICKRWHAMFNNPKSIRSVNSVIIDTSIKPNYIADHEEGELLDSTYTYGNTDMNWNVYVLLFLRRNNLLRIKSVVSDNQIYKIQISNINDVLLADNPDDQKLIDCIEGYRNKEYSYNIDGLNMMKKAITRVGKECWSEMFMNTYEYVDEYCGGCAEHDMVVQDLHDNLPLKKKITEPIRMVPADTDSLFNLSQNVVYYYENDENKKAIVNQIMSKRVDVFISEQSIFDYIDDHLATMQKSLLILDRKTLVKLIERECTFFLSGVMVILYPDTEIGISTYATSYVENKNRFKNIRCIHLIRENIEIVRYGRRISDLIDCTRLSKI